MRFAILEADGLGLIAAELAFAAGALMGATAGAARADVVSVINGYSITYPADKFGEDVVIGLPENYAKLPPAKEYYLDYEVWFESDWQWVKGGKLPGLVGGSHTSGCRDIVPDGWSARFMWHENGGGHFYYYHQNRVADCGDSKDFPSGMTFQKSFWNRITEHVVVNTPGKGDGSAEAWLNGQKVTNVTGITWRGNVAADVAMVDQVSLETFYGGSTGDWAPTATTHAKFSQMVVTTTLPDLSKPFVVPTGLGRSGMALPRGAEPGRRFALTLLGDGALPALPQGSDGSRLRLSDPQGRSAGSLGWQGGRWQWEGAPRRQSGLAFAFYETIGTGANGKASEIVGLPAPPSPSPLRTLP